MEDKDNVHLTDKNEYFAVVKYLAGRAYLRVGGIVLAVEGNTCHDASYGEQYWSADMLRQAAQTINHAFEREHHPGTVKARKTPIGNVEF